MDEAKEGYLYWQAVRLLGQIIEAGNMDKEETLKQLDEDL